MPPDPAPQPSEPATCSAFRRTAGEWLDGPTAAEGPDPAHAATCLDCRRYAAAVRVLSSGLAEINREPQPTASTGFTDRVIRAALRERRVRAYRRAGAGLAVAAGVLASVAVWWPRALTEPIPQSPVGPDLVRAPKPSPPSPVRVEQTLSEAGSALVALTRRTADEAVAPTRDLLPPLGVPTLSHSVVPPDAGPAVEALADFPQTAQAGVEPVANSARRAVALFLRDTGLSPAATH